MTEPIQPRWSWEQTDARRSGSSGDIAKLFKNEGTKQPGVFAVGAPSPAATLMAREVIQNSWDAARELRAELGDGAPEFGIDFVFRNHVQEAARKLWDRLDLSGLEVQLQRVSSTSPGARAKIGLGAENVLDGGSGVDAIRTLTIVERGTTGMYGPFDQAKSKMYLALISIGYTMKASGSGGSYGYGKAGLIAASATRTVLAYSCFRERSDDPGVTRRLLGMTYWGQHELPDGSYTGFARLGDAHDQWIKPFENEAADEFAASLGLETRDPARPHDLGTTFVVLDPEVAPRDLSVAIGRNWWPAMLDESFHPTVSEFDATGRETEHEVNPKRDALLRSFIRGWEIATMPQDNNVATEYRRSLGHSPAVTGSLPLGMIGLNADLGGWSYAQSSDTENDEDDEGATAVHASLVALIRGPRMVVEYYPYLPGTQPYVRGVFVAAGDDRVDDLLRQTEPKAHDAWLSKGTEDGVDPDAPVVAATVVKKVRESVREFQKRLKPPPPDPGDVRLPAFQELFRNLMTGKGPGKPKPPPPGQRDVAVQVQQRLVVDENGSDLRLKATVGLSLSPYYIAAETAVVHAAFNYKFLEDGSAGQPCDVTITAPSGFDPLGDAAFQGTLGRSVVEFDLVSGAYRNDWSGRLTVACSVISGGSPPPPGEAEAPGGEAE